MEMWGVLESRPCEKLRISILFDRSYFSKDDKMLGYGILDKQLLRESASELEHLQTILCEVFNCDQSYPLLYG